ncbi:hypothetical protein A9R05_41940 (plasmid) [Burkholderia sp. KK1]|uniref:Uncharacterized protein n=1 Tax=Burkholderia sp. M701 TaxID=326454 RepID=V5YMP4_9BURK|nr:hypothetical protein [Burkholderia sp. M701]AQH05587.1 hypothetical protein A9R05_41940 [Burkholderia sp. KK1]BAO18850.1 hypothetical protein [Burkholderia sp. M701]
MTASQSNLSDPHLGYDIVVATTQASINAALKQYLAGISSPEVIVCYIYDNQNNLVPIPYSDLKDGAKGSDPFAVANGASNDSQDLKNLLDANFAGAFKARIGIPSTPLSNIPPVITLGNGTDAPVLFNLLCAEFQVVGFEYLPHGKSSWVNQRQTPDDPWYFTSHVRLNSDIVDHNLPVPSDVQQRISELLHSAGDDAFSLQRLFLDLDEAILLSSPSIGGIPSGWPVWALITAQFMPAYFRQLQKTGTPVLGYSFSMTKPDPASLQIGALTHECSVLRDGNGGLILNPTPAQQAAATLDYLGTVSKQPPVAALFPWNWVEPDEVSQFAGVMAVRRANFTAYLARVFDTGVGNLCFVPNAYVTYDVDHNRFSARFTFKTDFKPATFSDVGNRKPDSDGYTPLLTLDYSKRSHDSAKLLFVKEVYGTYNYSLSAKVSVKDNHIRLAMHAQVYMKVDHDELGINYTDLGGANYYDKTHVVILQLAVEEHGRLSVSVSPKQIIDASTPWRFDPDGLMGLFGDLDNIRNGITDAEQLIERAIENAVSGYASSIVSAINGYSRWVFPGGRPFVFHDVFFSNNQDLICRVNYADPR